MRLIKTMVPVLFCMLCTCALPPRSWPRPEVAPEFKKTSLCVERLRFYTDEEFSEPAAETSLTEFVREEAKAGIEAKLKEAGFAVGECSFKSGSQLHIVVDAGVRNVLLVKFFIVARVRVYNRENPGPDEKELFQFFAETDIASSKEREVRRAGRVLAGKIAKELKAILSPSE